MQAWDSSLLQWELNGLSGAVDLAHLVFLLRYMVPGAASVVIGAAGALRSARGWARTQL